MTKKKLLIEITFEEEIDQDFDDKSLELKKLRVHQDSDLLTESESISIGERMAQSDWFQIDFWTDLQSIISQSEKKIKY